MAAAALLAQILSEDHVPNVLLNAGYVRVVQPLHFAAPRPQYTKASFAAILNWSEDEDIDSPQETSSVGYEIAEHEYLQIESTWPPRGLSGYEHGVYARQSMVEGPHPPAPEQIPSPPWSPRALYTPSDTSDTIAPILDGVREPFPDAEVAPQLTARCGPTVVTPAGHTHGSTEPVMTRPGFFLGRDGEEWPLPPAECMPSPLYAPPALSPLQRATPALVPSSASPARRYQRLPGDEQPGNSPYSTQSSASPGKLDTPGDTPIYWWQRRRRALPNVGVIGDGRPGAQSSRLKSTAVEDGRPEEGLGFADALGPALGLVLEPKETWGRSQKRRSPSPETVFVRGKDGTLWPLPPSEEDSLAMVGRAHRGRNPIPKW